LSRKNPDKTYLILEETKLAALGVYFNIQVFAPIPICTPLAIPLKLGRQKSFADGSTILKYINEAADEYKVRDHIVYQQKS
jgi:cation diffusion facilitator CzcD-associated flavoprotein CzcO